VTIFLNVADTLNASIDLIDICEVDDDGTTFTLPYSLRTTFCTLIAKRVIEDILFDHPALAAITDALLVQDKFRLVRQHDEMNAAPPENCNRQSAFKRMLTTSIAAHCTFKIGVQLFGTVLSSLCLSQRAQVPRTVLGLPPLAMAGMAPITPLPLPAPNKVSIKEDMDLKHFQAKDIPSLTRVADIKWWYNGLHSKGRVCGGFRSSRLYGTYLE
jgi:hypothetical protein